MKAASPRRAILVIVAVTAAICPRTRAAHADEDRPQIDGAQPIRCLHDGDGRLWRVQCSPPDAKEKICLYSPDAELLESGEWIRKLSRARPCYDEGAFDQNALTSQGYKLVLGRADSPYGWQRDNRNRVFQVIFDLHRRVYVGASWTPTATGPLLGGGIGPKIGSGAADVGLLETEWYHKGHGIHEGTRHRIALVRGTVGIAPFWADAVLFHYDVSRHYDDPLLRVTTFFGKPERHDITVHLGAWVDAGGLEVHHVPAGDEALWRLATAHLTYDVWQSEDLYSFVRLRAGAGAERTYAASQNRGADRDAITPAIACDANFTLDKKGFQHVTGLASFELPRYESAPAAAGKGAKRVKAELGYEVILIALNDQPLTLRVAGGATYRDDLPGVVPGWAFTATAGLRLSFWAPARRR
jgi:hypothetical protein